MKRPILTAAAGITLAAAVLIPAGLASAHTAQAGITTATCLAKGGWGATFSVTPTDLDKAPVATISGDASPYTITTFPYSTTVTDSTPDARTFHVHILWNDGYTWDGDETLTMPEGGCGPVETVPPPVAITVGAPAPTTVAPEPITIAEPTTILPTTTTTACVTPVTLEDGTQACNDTYQAPTTPAATARQLVLPHTGLGASTTALIGLGVAAIIAGIICLAAAIDRRKHQAKP